MIHFYAPVLRGNGYLRDATRYVRSWSHVIRRRGGFWSAEAQYEDARERMLDLFANGLMLDVRRTREGLTCWHGFLSAMELELDGATWQRSIFDVANRIKSLYTNIAPNLLTNGGGESGAWTGYNSPTTVEQSTAWKTDGTYSIHIVAGAASKGAWIQQTITIAARTVYDLKVSVKIESGTWLLAVVRDDTDEGLAEAQTNDAGEAVLMCSIADTNEYSGDVSIRIETVGATGEIYCDAGEFVRAPQQAETGLAEDTLSQAEYGRIEAVLLRAGLTTEAANNEVAAYLRDHAWPRTTPSEEFQIGAVRAKRAQPKLTLSLSGYWATLAFLHAPALVTDDASVLIENLIAPSPYVSVGRIQNNTTQIAIDARAPIKITEALLDIAAASDTTGLAWSIGVYEDRQLVSEPIERRIDYRFVKGQMRDANRALVALECVRPGWMYLEDTPVTVNALSPDGLDDPHWVYIDEVQFEEPDTLRLRKLDDNE